MAHLKKSSTGHLLKTSTGHLAKSCDGDPPGSIFQTDLAAIRRSSCLLIVLDGRAVNEGAAFELGIAYALGKRCYGLQTDVRRLLPFGNNPMIDHALTVRRITQERVPATLSCNPFGI